jgi:hypothetical protein
MHVETEALYADKLVVITPAALTFHNYYLWGADKTVPVNDIEKIGLFEPTMMNGKWRLWGTTGFGGWFPLDWNRPSRDCIFIMRRKSKNFRIGFTAEDSLKAEDALRGLGLIRE